MHPFMVSIKKHKLVRTLSLDKKTIQKKVIKYAFQTQIHNRDIMITGFVSNISIAWSVSNTNYVIIAIRSPTFFSWPGTLCLKFLQETTFWCKSALHIWICNCLALLLLVGQHVLWLLVGHAFAELVNMEVIVFAFLADLASSRIFPRIFLFRLRQGFRTSFPPCPDSSLTKTELKWFFHSSFLAQLLSQSPQ